MGFCRLSRCPACCSAGGCVGSSSGLDGSFVLLLLFWCACVFLLLFFGDLALLCCALCARVDTAVGGADARTRTRTNTARAHKFHAYQNHPPAAPPNHPCAARCSSRAYLSNRTNFLGRFTFFHQDLTLIVTALMVRAHCPAAPCTLTVVTAFADRHVIGQRRRARCARTALHARSDPSLGDHRLERLHRPDPCDDPQLYPRQSAQRHGHHAQLQRRLRALRQGKSSGPAFPFYLHSARCER